MDRKEKVKILGEHLGIEPEYLGAPSFDYQVGAFTVDRGGRILSASGDEVELEDILSRPGENVAYELGIPMAGHDGRTLRNIINMICSKQHLIKKALGLDEDLVDEDFVTKINEADINSIDSFKEALETIGSRGHPGMEFDFGEKLIIFKHTRAETAARLFALISKKAKEQARTSPKVTATDNEKYTFRTWLLRLGMIGDEYAETRKELLQNLSGNSAFRNPERGEL